MDIRDDQFSLVNLIINKFSDKYGITSKEVYTIFKKFDIISYLVEDYDILHTQGTGYVMGDILEVLHGRGFDTISWNQRAV